jgi:hypothetical protein
MRRRLVGLICLLLLCAEADARPVRRRAPRFLGRLQILSGAGFTLPQRAAGDRTFAAYVPLDIELSLVISGPLSFSLGGAAFLAPFEAPGCSGPGRRPNALASFFGLRLDANNNRDRSWLSPWLALRVGLVGQDGIPGLDPQGACGERIGLSAYVTPRAGLDIWLGRAAATFALGYDVLPRASSVSAELGLTLRLF